MKSKLPTEHDIQNQIIQYLRLKGYYVLRINSGMMSYSYGDKRAFMKLADAGTPDLFVLKNAKPLFIEVKRPGNKATPVQIAKMKEIEAHGATCFIIDSLDKAQEYGL